LAVRLASVEVIPYALPFRRPYVTARGALDRREMVLLRLRDSDGLVGLGEAVPLSLRGGASLREVVGELEGFARTGDERLAASAPARCALSTALFDLEERRAGTVAPVAPIPCNATLVAGEPAAVAQDALRWAAEGFGTFKLKLGAGEDVAQVLAVREALGPEAKIRVDANAAWSLAEAKRVLAAIEPLDIELAEQPVASMEEAAELAGASSIPLAGDESIAGPRDAERAVELGAFQCTGIKLSKVGGIAAGAAIAALMPAYVASALDGPVGIAASAHLARRLHYEKSPWAGEPRLAHGLATQRLFASTVAAIECELREGMLHPPAGPGLGVEIDEDALNAHRL
jgi:muconate cycloisomerase